MQKKKNYYRQAIMLQIFIIVILISNCLGLSNAKKLYQGVDKFEPVSATLINSIEKRKIGGKGRATRIRYNNKYYYEVDGNSYTVVFYDERSKGRDRTLYYNPNNPNVCAKYSTYNEYASHNSDGFLLFIIGQAIVVVLFVVAISSQRNEKLIQKSSGVVLQNDLDLIMDDMIEEKQEMERKEDVQSIPFQRGNNNTTVQSPWENGDINYNKKDSQEDKIDFPLYTEEEYRKLNR